ncbi:MAG: hypothetical protein ACJAVF_004349 [Paraglaciecola sp.]|jgi:hypothetical protein
MNKNLLILTIGFFFLNFTFQNWQVYKSFEGKFRVLVPAEMSAKVDSIETEVGKLAYHTYLYQPEDVKVAENLIYMVSYVDYPELSIHSDSTDLIEEFFDNTVESATEAVMGNLIYASETTLNDYPGRLWRIEYLEDRAVIKTRAFLVENRYYAIQTICLKEKALNSSSDKFFNSFHVFEPK